MDGLSFIVLVCMGCQFCIFIIQVFKYNNIFSGKFGSIQDKIQGNIPILFFSGKGQFTFYCVAILIKCCGYRIFGFYHHSSFDGIFFTRQQVFIRNYIGQFCFLTDHAFLIFCLAISRCGVDLRDLDTLSFIGDIFVACYFHLIMEQFFESYDCFSFQYGSIQGKGNVYGSACLGRSKGSLCSNCFTVLLDCFFRFLIH